MVTNWIWPVVQAQYIYIYIALNMYLLLYV